VCRSSSLLHTASTQAQAARCLSLARGLQAVSVNMPSLSPTMEEGTIVKWLKAEGEAVAAGDVVCDIQTDKAVVAMEVDDDGTLAKILKGADSGVIKVGELIAVVAEDGEDWREVAAKAGAAPVESSSAAPPPTQAAAAAPSFAGGSTPGAPVKMPSLSPTMSEGSIVAWHKKEGDSVAAGDVLCDIQTDKAVVSMECDDDGILAKILIGEGGELVEVGTLIALMVEEGQDWKDVMIPSEGSQAPAPSASSEESTPAQAPAAAAAQPLVFVHPPQVGPAAALLLSQYGLDPKSIDGSGPKGNLTKSDVLGYIKTNAISIPVQESSKVKAVKTEPKESPAAAAPPAGRTVAAKFTDVELTSMRKVIAKRLTESKQEAPHGYSSATANITTVSQLRQEYIRSGFKVSINDFVIKAVATALQYIPQINANVINEELVPLDNIDISVAVATPAGLITPIVKDAALKSVQEISANVKELAGRAKENKLKLDEFQGGTFTISNLGMFGIAEFTAIINAPQVAILAVGGGRQIIDPITMKPTTVMTATLSFDRRYIDEASAADFMKVYQTIMERPELLGVGYLPSVKLDRVASSIP